MFDKVLASVRIGAATVDTRLDQDVLVPGEEFSAQIVVEGGNADQEIDGLVLKLEVELKEDSGEVGRNKVIDTWHVHDEFTIHEGEQRVIDFEGRLHPETPVTDVDARLMFEGVWIATGMDIEKAIDASDKDYLRIAPTEPMAAMMDAVEKKGFRLDRVTTDPDRIRIGSVESDLACDQEFVYKPTGSHHDSNLEEIEVHFVPRENRTHVLLEFDRRRGSESFRSMTIDHDDYSVDGLAKEFEREMRNR